MIMIIGPIFVTGIWMVVWKLTEPKKYFYARP